MLHDWDDFEDEHSHQAKRKRGRPLGSSTTIPQAAVNLERVDNPNDPRYVKRDRDCPIQRMLCGWLVPSTSHLESDEYYTKTKWARKAGWSFSRPRLTRVTINGKRVVELTANCFGVRDGDAWL